MTLSQDVMDALADAETLRLGWWGHPSSPSLHLPLVAADYGMRAARLIASGWDDEASVVYHVRMAARAGLRAVPELRA